MLVAGEGFHTPDWVTYLVFLAQLFQFDYKSNIHWEDIPPDGWTSWAVAQRGSVSLNKMKVFYTRYINVIRRKYVCLHIWTDDKLVFRLARSANSKLLSLSLREGILACSSASQETILTATSITIAIQYFCIHSKTRQKNPWGNTLK